MRQIIIIIKGEEKEVHTTVTRLCRMHPEFSYHYLKRQKFPFTYKDWGFKKLGVNGGMYMHGKLAGVFTGELWDPDTTEWITTPEVE